MTIKEDRLREAEDILELIALRCFMDGSKNFCKMPLTLRDRVDEYLKKYRKELKKDEPAGSVP